MSARYTNGITGLWLSESIFLIVPYAEASPNLLEIWSLICSGGEEKTKAALRNIGMLLIIEIVVGHLREFQLSVLLSNLYHTSKDYYCVN
jgi:hypothetical protein